MRSLITVLLLASCAAQPKVSPHFCTPLTYSVTTNNQLTPVLKRMINNAVFYWNTEASTNLLNQNEGKNTVEFKVVKQQRLSLFNRQAAAQVILYTREQCVVRAKVKLGNFYVSDPLIFQTIVRHEIGHIMGFLDSPNFTDLMSYMLYESLDHPRPLSPSELLELQHILKENKQ
jgi:hypothetical protein